MEEPKDTIICPECGAKCESFAIYCPECKCKLKRNDTLILFLLTLFLLAFISIIIYFYPKISSIIQFNLLNSKSETSSDNDQTSAKTRNWQSLGNQIYLDLNSVQIQDYDYVMADFKEYNFENKSPSVSYRITSIAAFCNLEENDNIKKLEYPIHYYYDKNDKFLSKDDIHEFWKKEFPDGHLGITHPEDLEYGDIYFDTLCN